MADRRDWRMLQDPRDRVDAAWSGDHYRYGSLYDIDDGRVTFAQGPHRGKGPKGWPSSGRLRDQACKRLADHGLLDASRVDVEVDGDEVTLTGTVPSRRAKCLAEALIEDIPGVHDVHNRLTIAPTGEPAVTAGS